MEHGFSIFMLIFAGAILAYAGLLALTKDYTMLPYRAQHAVKPKNPKLYAKKLAGVIALAALAPALGGLVGFWHPIAGVIVMIASFVLFLWIGTKMMKGVK